VKGQIRSSASARLGQVQGASRRIRPPRFLPTRSRRSPCPTPGSLGPISVRYALLTSRMTAITGSGLGWGRFAAGHVIARSVSTLAGQADTASGRVAGQGECLSRKRWRERDDRAGSLRAVPGSAGHAGICSVHMRVYRTPVTAARLLDGARSVLGYQTRYAAVGCHHGLQVLQPTR